MNRITFDVYFHEDDCVKNIEEYPVKIQYALVNAIKEDVIGLERILNLLTSNYKYDVKNQQIQVDIPKKFGLRKIIVESISTNPNKMMLHNDPPIEIVLSLATIIRII